MFTQKYFTRRVKYLVRVFLPESILSTRDDVILASLTIKGCTNNTEGMLDNLNKSIKLTS